ncbi:hypothetical protein DFP72DRAFT_475906 [Ephemerocybe angulata]|uniref:Uncharacterized protein n=1 Tax=Ephemerocybe angulata TaxID=980116 RepID=A0A8H6HTJ9_9AGAR|nr:hypothetical protein DFP72DRAFT_475906 [Tulosesus angulatus]
MPGTEPIEATRKAKGSIPRTPHPSDCRCEQLGFEHTSTRTTYQCRRLFDAKLACRTEVARPVGAPANRNLESARMENIAAGGYPKGSMPAPHTLRSSPTTTTALRKAQRSDVTSGWQDLRVTMKPRVDRHSQANVQSQLHPLAHSPGVTMHTCRTETIEARRESKGSIPGTPHPSDRRQGCYKWLSIEMRDYWLKRTSRTSLA